MENQFRKNNIMTGTQKNKEKIRQIEQKLQTISEAKMNCAKDEKMTATLNRSAAV